MNKKIINRNVIFILLIGIEGLAFGLLDWDSVISDLVYLQHNNKLLISIIGSNVLISKFIATLICIYLSDNKKPNKIFIICVSLCSIVSLFVGITYKLNWLIPFSILYTFEALIFEVYSGYHYAYTYNSLPQEKASEVHSKRISIFKITFMIGIAIASYFTAKYTSSTMTIVTISSTIILLLLIIPISNVKNFPVNKNSDTMPLKQKLNLKNYTSYYKKWIVARFLGKFALSSLVVLLSVKAIDINLNLVTLKSFKTIAWLLSSIGFWFSAYLIKNKIIIKGDIICKLLISILVAVSFFFPIVIYVVLVLNGLLNPFNTMSNFTMLGMDKDNIGIAQKELLINLFGYFSGILSSYILLNIRFNIAIIIVVITLSLSVLIEIKLYYSKRS